jgi:hypothetical protein
MELVREYTVVVAREPVLVIEPRDDRAHAFPDRRVIFRHVELIGE